MSIAHSTSLSKSCKLQWAKALLRRSETAACNFCTMVHTEICCLCDVRGYERRL